MPSCTRAIYIINALHSTCTETLLYYELSLAARAAPSQLCLQDKACSGCSYMMEYYTERMQQGASEASPPACMYYLWYSWLASGKRGARAHVACYIVVTPHAEMTA